MDKIPVLVSWALLLLYGAAERQHFLQSNNFTWDEGRNHCQVCYKDLATLTSGNIQTIVQNLTSDYWIGLRKSFTSGSTKSWSRWANGDPLTFQNWYPGRPIAKPYRFTANSSCFSLTSCGDISTTYLGSGDVDEDDEYIEDPCVAMYSFGAWFETNCSNQLPYLCYDDCYDANIKVEKLTSSDITLSWSPGPGNISHYQVEVKGDDNWGVLKVNHAELTYDLLNLTAGTLYTVKVFPVKCERALNPGVLTFYTKPGAVRSLGVMTLNENSVVLSWSPPTGKRDSYCVKVRGRPEQMCDIKTDRAEVDGLLSGGLYVLDVVAVVNRSEQGDSVNITTYTKPSRVLNPTVSHQTTQSLLLQWEPPVGNTTGYRMNASHSSHLYFTKDVNETSVWVTNLTPGSKLLLNVVALASKTLEGAVTMVEGYTKPEPVSDLNLISSKSSVTANWHLPGSNYEYFIVELQSDGSNKIIKTSNETSLTFDDLSPAANCTVTVYTVSGTFHSDPQVMSTFTLPVEPRSATIRPCNTSMPCKSNLTLEWVPPEGVVTATYLVRYKAKFWSNTWQEFTVSNNLNSVEIIDLHPGTTYDFEVQTKAGNLISDPATASGCTAPEKRNLTLSMLCSSSELLFCNKESTIAYVMNELKSHFESHLDGVFWELRWKEP